MEQCTGYLQNYSQPVINLGKWLTVLYFNFVAIEVDPIIQFTTRLENMYKVQRFIIYEQTWPPNQPIFYVPQSLMYHQGKYCKEEADMMMELIHIDDNYKVTLEDTNPRHQALQDILSRNKSTKVTKKLTVIFESLCKRNSPKFLLIEGHQGMGKTIILKEIAYRWAKNELLTTCKIVFLVRLQDPKVHKLKTWSDFLQYYCVEKDIDNAFASSDNINSDKIAFLFDSFEEFPTDSWEDSFIYKVLMREVLPSCVLVITSCPHASARLREHATVRVCLLGFTEVGQKRKFISNALQDEQQIKEVTQHLEHDSTLKKFCFSPIHMVFLLHIYLYSRDLFISNIGKLYEHIACLIICRHLAKYYHNSFENTMYNLNNLPDNYSKILMQLCKLAVDHPRTKMKIVFTSDIIKETCPDIFRIPGAINGFGLLQAVQCDGLTGRIMKFSFSHPIIPEALAAYYNQIPNSQLKCLRLFKTHHKAGNQEFCRRIANAKVFDKQTINLRGTSLSSSDIKCLALILTQSPHRKWEEVDLHGCDIKDSGIVILHKELINHNITIGRLSLSNNNLTKTSLSKIHEIVTHCSVKVLAIRHNPAIGKDTKFYSAILSDNSVIEELYMSNTNCMPSGATTKMFSALEKNQNLKVLQTINNNITDHDCDAIVRMLENNTSLVELNISGNQITATNAKRIIQALTNNKTLEYLALPWYKPKYQKNIAKLAKKVDKNRYRHHQCRLNLFCHRPFNCY